MSHDPLSKKDQYNDTIKKCQFFYVVKDDPSSNYVEMKHFLYLIGKRSSAPASQKTNRNRRQNYYALTYFQCAILKQFPGC